MGRTACTKPQCLYQGALYLNFLGLYVKYPTFLPSFNLVWNFSTILHKNLQHQSLRRSFRPIKLAVIKANRWTDRETDERTHTMKLAKVFYEGANTLEK